MLFYERVRHLGGQNIAGALCGLYGQSLAVDIAYLWSRDGMGGLYTSVDTSSS